jgi:Protein of unknown function, DUF547
MRIIPALFIAISLASPVSARWMLPQVGQSQWDALLKQFVNVKHRVDYAGLKEEGAQRLNEYIDSLERPGTQALSPDEKKALLIDAYNAFTIQWVVENYPVRSIWTTDSPFTVRRHKLGGKMVSLDEIESQLRAMGDPRIHAALVCAARSCPPLRREAYVASRLNDQLDDNVREWLANPSLNRFEPSQSTAIISPIFKWYQKDFDAYPGGRQGFLRKYAPADMIKEIGDKQLKISYLTYDWGLNDQAGLGENYSHLQFAIDWVLNWLRNLGS